MLPTELILTIVPYLTTIDRACLALTCKTFAATIGPSPWEESSKAKRAEWGRHDDMLDALQRDLQEEYWRCTDCVLFHARVKVQRLPSKKSRWDVVPKWAFSREENRELRIGPEEAPIYTITSSFVESIMARHLHSAPSGLCLNALKCRGSRTFTMSPITIVILDYTFTSKIVLDRLLLRTTYTFRQHRTMFVNNMPLAEKPLEEYLSTLPFNICKHQKLASAFTLYPPLPDQPLASETRCAYCPTQWVFRLSTPHEIRLDVYHNLGEGRSKEDERWKFLAQPVKKRMKRYAWGKEDVEQAFERIMCSTMEEFKKQLERSDGRGSWYDPLLMCRAYKTLPESVGMAL
jgi:hypothetical protein